MGDLLAGNGDSKVPSSPGKRVARHAAEQPLPAPYAGRRMAPPVAPAAPEPQPEPVAPPSAYVGRRVKPVEQAPEPVVAIEPVLVPAPEPVLAPAPEPVVLTAPEPIVLTAPEPIVLTAPEPMVPTTLEPVELPVLPDRSAAATSAATSTTAAGRRAAPRRHLVSRLPSAPLVAGIAVLAVSAGGALQAMNPASAGAADSHRLVAANAFSGTSGVASASLLQGRGTVVSRSGDRSSTDSLQAAADAQAQQRDQALSAFAAKAEKTAARLKLHQWVLPVAAGTYDLTARFGDYSSLWSHFHTGLDFAAPTGTPIMAVAGGTITETAYSGAFGNRTIETLSDGTELWYCHQNAFGTTVGARVNPGQVIGYVGSTGNVTGPHLHLEVHPGGGDAVDPYAALVAHGLYPGPPR